MKNKTDTTIHLYDEALVQGLKDFCKKQGITQNKFAENAIRKELERRKRESNRD